VPAPTLEDWLPFGFASPHSRQLLQPYNLLQLINRRKVRLRRCTNKTMRKCKEDASIENQLKIDRLDQNRLQYFALSACFQFSTPKIERRSVNRQACSDHQPSLSTDVSSH
jgi:hypothetical protein